MTTRYTDRQLNTLNAMFCARVSRLRGEGIDVEQDDAKSLLDRIAEQVLADFDGEGV